MDETFLYRKIADTIRMQILRSELRPGEYLPSVRTMAEQWGCTQGTIQRAYRELSRHGLVTSRPGQGTRVADSLPARGEAALHTASLINRTEAFLLEVLTAGYLPSEVEDAFRLALDRWRVVEQQAAAPAALNIRFAGSHDLAVTWLAGHFAEILPGYQLNIGFMGSLGGLRELAENRADIAGSHLWDEASDTYNLPYVQRLMPGQRMALVTLAYRRLGLIVPAGDPDGISDLADLTRRGLRFVNRQAGSGTRVWLDAQLRRLGIDSNAIAGYELEKATHSEVARTVAQGDAHLGLGLEAAASPFGLDFIPLTRERYDLVMYESYYQTPAVQKLVSWLSTQAAQAFSGLIGYDTSATGETILVG
jgi:putative molybdopterin biosynthesis protein